MTASIQQLRERLASREATLTTIRSRVQSAKDDASQPRAQPSISDIQRRYLSAVADLDKKDKEVPKPFVRSSNDAVSSLANKWNKGIEGKKVEKTAVDVRADIDGAKKNFSAKDAPRLSSKSSTSATKKSEEPQPEQLIVEDGSEVPSWAKNQQKLVIKKENARSSVRDVDVRDIQGSVLESAARDGSEAERTEVNVGGGNVKAALAMWGKTAEEDASALARKKEEEEKRAAAAEKAKKEQEAERQIRAVKAASAKFENLQLSDLKSEPEDELELIAFLERKIALVDKDIKAAEDELDKLESSQ